MDLEQLLDALRMQESGGDPTAVSPAGARGPYQIMPKTGAQPGFGVAPIPAGMLENEGESRRFARDYLTAMMKRYKGDTNKALAAYNAGPGTVDKGGKLPAETQAYVPGVLNRVGKTPQRTMFDQLVQKFNPVSAAQAAEGPLGDGAGAVPDSPLSRPMTEADMAGPGQTATKTMPGAPGPAPAQDPGMLGGFAINDAGAQPAQPEPQMNLAPPGAAAAPPAQNSNLDPEAIMKLLDDEEPQKPAGPWGTIGPALVGLGAGIAGNANRGWGAGIGAGLSQATDNVTNQRTLDLANRREERQARQDRIEGLPAKVAFASLISQGVPANEAFLRAYSPNATGKWDTQVVGETSSGKKIYKQTNSITGETRDVPGVGGGEPEGPEPEGEDLLKTLDANTASVVKALASYEFSPKDLAVRGNRKETLLALAQRVNPEFQPMQYQNIFAAKKAFGAGGNYGNALRSADQAIHHLGLLKKKFDELNTRAGGPMDSGTFGAAAYNYGRGKFLGAEADEALVGAKSPVEALTHEIGKFFQGAGVTAEGSLREWRESLHANMSPQEQKAALTSLLELMSGGFQSYRNIYNNTVGPAYSKDHPFEEVFKFAPHSYEILKDIGVDVGITGEGDHTTTPEKSNEVAAVEAPSGVDPAEWQHMTPEERALWKN